METSKEALIHFNKSGNKEIHYKRIKRTLRALKEACAKKIAYGSGLTQHQVARRLCELVKMNQVEVIDKRMTDYHETKVNIYKFKE